MRYPVVLALGLLVAIAGMSSPVRANGPRYGGFADADKPRLQEKKPQVHVINDFPLHTVHLTQCGSHGGGNAGGGGRLNTAATDKVHSSNTGGGGHTSSCPK